MTSVTLIKTFPFGGIQSDVEIELEESFPFESNTTEKLETKTKQKSLKYGYETSGLTEKLKRNSSKSAIEEDSFIKYEIEKIYKEAIEEPFSDNESYVEIAKNKLIIIGIIGEEKFSKLSSGQVEFLSKHFASIDLGDDVDIFSLIRKSKEPEV